MQIKLLFSLLVLMSVLFGGVSAAEDVGLLTEDTQPVNVQVDKDHALFVIATWCPYSQKFVELLNDDEIKPFLTGKVLSFAVLPEWETVESKLSKRGQISRLPEIKKKSGHPYLYDPKLIDKLPGGYFYIGNQQLLQSIKGFPAAYSNAEHGFKVDVDTWIKLNTAAPKDLIVKKFKEYGLD